MVERESPATVQEVVSDMGRDSYHTEEIKSPARVSGEHVLGVHLKLVR